MTIRQTVQRIEFAGEFTIFAAAELRERLLAAIADADEIDADLSGVAEIDSAGLQLMVAAKREAAVRGKTLRFTNHSQPVLDILDLCELSAHLGDPVLIRARA